MKSRNSLVAFVAVLSFFHFSPQTINAAEESVDAKEDNQEVVDEGTVSEKQDSTEEAVLEEEVTKEEDQTTEESSNSTEEQKPVQEKEAKEQPSEQQSSEEKSGEDANQKADTEAEDSAEEPKRAMMQQRAVEAPDVLEVGVSHPSVVVLKEKLNAIGFDGIRETEYYGNWTKTRVEDFQSNYGLPVTGVADSTTLEKLDEVYTSPFQYGKRHEDTVDLKEKLNRAGFGYITVTTYYGSFTKNQVAQFQEYVGLEPNGIADAYTRQKLDELLEAGYQEGDRHEAISDMKEKLNALGFGNILVTDYFGSFTTEKVTDFQNYYGLEVTGTANQETLNKLDTLMDTPFQYGGRDDAIIPMKEKLNALGFGYITVTNYYGAFTRSQVKEFQSYYGLVENGIADEPTRNKLDEVMSNSLKQGESYDDLPELKEKLNRLGFGHITVTNYYGNYTEKKVRDFQEAYGLVENGMIDPVTREKLEELSITGFQKGARHEGIVDLKEDLNRLGFGYITVTTYYGSYTEKRVKDFQRYYGLNVTGTADNSTFDKINELLSSSYQEGERHNDIIPLKEKLNWLDFGYITVTDYYGSYTEVKVKDFQRAYDLPASGIADEPTREKIDEVLADTFQKGNRHSKFVDLKQGLNRLGFDGISVTNYYGSFTERRVSEFQSYYGLQETGKANYETLNKLDELLETPFQEGERNKETSDMKEKLNSIGFGSILVSDLYGSYTAKKVRDFQDYYGLVVNGIADPVTLEKLDSVYGSPYQQGKRHDDMIGFKEDLNRLGFGHITVTTLFGSYTKQKVEEFQAHYGLIDNGIIDSVTEAKIKEIVNSPFQKGKTHSEIPAIKEKLNDLGYGTIQVTEYFGDFTEKVLKEFQRDYGLPVSGIADPVTLKTLEEAAASREVETVIRYDITLEEALNKQMSQLQQTDKYRNDPAYIHHNYVDITETGIITGSSVNVRTSPDLDNSSNVKYTLTNGTAVTILSTVNGDSYGGSKKWYRIRYNEEILYVHSSLADPNGLAAVTTSRVNIRSQASNTSHIYDTVPAGTVVNILEEGGTWHKISYNAWRNPTRADVEYYLDPSNNDRFQHLVLSESVEVSATELNRVLAGKGILAGKGQAFIDGGKQYGVNEIYLISHALLETGHGTSPLATGTEVGKDSSGNLRIVTTSNEDSLTDKKTVYNMFGINANDGDAHRLGAFKAYREGWTSPEKAIRGGAKFIGEDYIHNSYEQNTLYKMRWNPANPGYPQYATDIAWATKQVTNIKNMYDMLDNPLLKFNIVQYK
ncbi:peptidoglycan-binding protein [Oceanobacillus kapialis]|uniref:Peptidoglycan-binding protein n=1 Tax=Oceanobacillus kapialis TaxID=481353 RepID=A0ABW5PZZ8_9BACI